MGGVLTPRHGRFTPGKETRYPLYRRLGGPQGHSGRVRKISPSPTFDSRTVNPVFLAVGVVPKGSVLSTETLRPFKRQHLLARRQFSEPENVSFSLTLHFEMPRGC